MGRALEPVIHSPGLMRCTDSAFVMVAPSYNTALACTRQNIAFHTPASNRLALCPPPSCAPSHQVQPSHTLPIASPNPPASLPCVTAPTPTPPYLTAPCPLALPNPGHHLQCACAVLLCCSRPQWRSLHACGQRAGCLTASPGLAQHTGLRMGRHGEGAMCSLKPHLR